MTWKRVLQCEITSQANNMIYYIVKVQGVIVSMQQLAVNPFHFVVPLSLSNTLLRPIIFQFVGSHRLIIKKGFDVWKGDS